MIFLVFASSKMLPMLSISFIIVYEQWCTFLSTLFLTEMLKIVGMCLSWSCLGQALVQRWAVVSSVSDKIQMLRHVVYVLSCAAEAAGLATNFWFIKHLALPRLQISLTLQKKKRERVAWLGVYPSEKLKYCSSENKQRHTWMHCLSQIFK